MTDRQTDRQTPFHSKYRAYMLSIARIEKVMLNLKHTTVNNFNLLRSNINFSIFSCSLFREFCCSPRAIVSHQLYCCFYPDIRNFSKEDIDSQPLPFLKHKFCSKSTRSKRKDYTVCKWTNHLTKLRLVAYFADQCSLVRHIGYNRQTMQPHWAYRTDRRTDNLSTAHTRYAWLCGSCAEKSLLRPTEKPHHKPFV